MQTQQLLNSIGQHRFMALGHVFGNAFWKLVFFENFFHEIAIKHCPGTVGGGFGLQIVSEFGCDTAPPGACHPG